MTNKLRSAHQVLCVILVSMIIGCAFKEQKIPKAVYNIPLLIGKNIDEVRTILGKPLENPPDPLKPQKEHFENLYDKEGQLLLIYFYPDTRKIESFHIVSSIGYDSVKTVLKIGKLDFKNTNDYWIEPGERYFTNTYNAVTIHLK